MKTSPSFSPFHCRRRRLLSRHQLSCSLLVLPSLLHSGTYLYAGGGPGIGATAFTAIPALKNRKVSTLTLANGHSQGQRQQLHPKNRLYATKPDSLSDPTMISNHVRETLDPCVVLMKEMMAEYSSLWQDKGGVVSLAQGVVYWDPPETVTASLQDALTDPLVLQTLPQYGPDEGLDMLRTNLEEKLAQENGLTNHRTMITAGANQAYMNCVLTLLQPGDKSVVFAPYYFNHVMAIQIAVGNDGLCVGSCSAEGVPDLEWLERTIQNDDSIRMVTITNPGNPTGVSLDRATLQKAVDLCRQYNKWLVLDSTYEHFDHTSSSLDKKDSTNKDDDNDEATAKDETPRGLPCFPDPHVLHIFSFSKGYALAGYRCGYVVLPKDDPHNLYDQMMKVQDTVPICPSRISQIAALGALRSGRQWVLDRVKTLAIGREAILAAMADLPQIMGGSGAMYLMGKLPEGTDDQEFARTLVRDHGVAVIPGSFCAYPGWIRVCYSNLPPKECKMAAKRLEEGIQKLCGSPSD